MCNAKPDAKPIVYDAEGKKLMVNDAEGEEPIVNDAEGKKVKRDLADVCHANLRVSGTN